MTPEKVRIATVADEPEIMNLLSMMHAEGGIMPLDQMEASAMFHRAFNRQGGILGVIGEPGDIKAMIYLLISKFWYTKQYHLEELFNFVRPDKRFKPDIKTPQHNYGRQMIQFAKSCSDEIGLPLTIGVLTNIRMEGKVRMYRRELGVPVGAWFGHNLHWVNEEPNAAFWKNPFPPRNRISSGKDLRLKMASGR